MHSRNQSGASLIEVLIALTLVAVTMLGLLGLQLRSMGAQKDSMDRRSAAVLVAGFAERITANFAGFETRQYDNLTLNPLDAAANNNPPSAAACAAPTNCTAAEIAARDWALFANEVRTRLPGGVAFVNTPADLSRTDVTVGWLDVQKVSDRTVGGAAQPTLAGVVLDPTCPAAADFNLGANPGNVRYRCYVAQVYP